MTGRPTTLDDPIVVGKRTITLAEAIIERVRLGSYKDRVAHGVGISHQTLHNWRLAGGRARRKLGQGQELTDSEKRYLVFLEALESAEADQEARRLGRIEAAAQGQRIVKEVVKVDGDGNVIERTTTEENRPGEWTADAWFLERRFPEQYGRRKVEVSGPDGGPIPLAEVGNDVGERVLAAIREVKALSSDNAIDAESREAPADAER